MGEIGRQRINVVERITTNLREDVKMWRCEDYNLWIIQMCEKTQK